jgi:DNA-binding NarL/FixJ family response regulator
VNTSASRDTIRVLCLYDGSQQPLDVTALLACDDALNFLGSFDVAPGPIAQLRDLDPNVAIVQLPMSALQLLRWVSFLRRHLQDCTILVTGPQDEPYYRQSVMSYGADEFIPEDQLPQRLVRRITALRQKPQRLLRMPPNTRPVA